MVTVRLFSAARAVYYVFYRLTVRLRCRCQDWLGGGAAPPAMLRFRVSESTSVEEFHSVGRNTVLAIEQALEAAGRPLATFGAVLDFGCGCGRTLSWMARAAPGLKLHGTDVDGEAVAWCRTNLPGIQFGTNGALPPLNYADNSFDLAYAISVFTHLNEDHQRRWLAELGRVVRPGGLLLFSVHGARCRAGVTVEDGARLAQCGFLHKTSAKLRGIVPAWYHTTYHSRDYVLRAVSEWFRPVSYAEGGLGYQDLVIVERPRAEESVARAV
jgi:SAM-dependent methyltransferase